MLRNVSHDLLQIRNINRETTRVKRPNKNCFLKSAALSRQRSRVRAPSSPLFIPSILGANGLDSDYPQSNPPLLMDRWRLHPHLLEECSLSRLHLGQV